MKDEMGMGRMAVAGSLQSVARKKRNSRRKEAKGSGPEKRNLGEKESEDVLL
jgi:hypothetical protein